MSDEQQDNQEHEQSHADEPQDAVSATVQESEGEESPVTELYELGYHFVPTLEEEALAGKVTELRSYIEELGGTMFSEQYPELIELAYPMDKRIAGKRQQFASAHFGWMKFELAKDKAPELARTCEANDEIIRSLLIKTERESVYSQPRQPREEKRAEQPEQESQKREQVSDEELDKSLEELVA